MPFEDYLDAQRTFAKYSENKLRKRVRWILFFVILCSIFTVFGQGTHFESVSIPQVMAAATFLIFFAILAFAPHLLLTKRAMMKRYSREVAQLTDVTYELDEDMIHSRAGSGAESHIPWSAFDGFIETDRSWVLFRGYTFFAIPKSVLSTDDARAFREILSRKMSPYKLKG